MNMVGICAEKMQASTLQNLTLHCHIKTQHGLHCYVLRALVVSSSQYFY